MEFTITIPSWFFATVYTVGFWLCALIALGLSLTAWGVSCLKSGGEAIPSCLFKGVAHKRVLLINTIINLVGLVMLWLTPVMWLVGAFLTKGYYHVTSLANYTVQGYMATTPWANRLIFGWVVIAFVWAALVKLVVPYLFKRFLH